MFIDSLTQQWVRATGRWIDESEHAWLAGPNGAADGIGPDFFDRWAEAQGCEVASGEAIGLLPTFDELASEHFDPAGVHPEVRAFYERTAQYRLDAWARWSPPFRSLAWLVRTMFGARLGQLNVPIHELETTAGMTSRVAHVRHPGASSQLFAAWVRTFAESGQTIYCGAYSICSPPNLDRPCVRVAFPLPNGRAVVVLRPVNRPDGGVILVSSGDCFGDAGFYFVTYNRDGECFARYVRSMRESIEVRPPLGDVLIAEHRMRFAGLRMAHLRYRMERAAPLRSDHGVSDARFAVSQSLAVEPSLS